MDEIPGMIGGGGSNLLPRAGPTPEVPPWISLQVARAALQSDKVEIVAYNDPFIHGEVRRRTIHAVLLWTSSP